MKEELGQPTKPLSAEIPAETPQTGTKTTKGDRDESVEPNQGS